MGMMKHMYAYSQFCIQKNFASLLVYPFCVHARATNGIAIKVNIHVPAKRASLIRFTDLNV